MTPETRARSIYGVRPRALHFTESQAAAYQFLCDQLKSDQETQQLTNPFTKSGLKRVYRFLAKRLHPDLGGNARDFRTLRSHFETLIAIF